MKDVLTLQDEVAQDIAEEIRVKLTPEERTRLAGAHPVDPAAHDAYLRGRYFWNRRTEADLYKAKTYFDQAIAEDPQYPAAYSGLADTYFYLGYAWGHLLPREAMPMSKEAALKALQLDDNSAEGHTSLGIVKMFYDWDFPGAKREFQRAVALNPNYATAHHTYAVLLSAIGRFDESIAEARKAVEVDPLSLPVNYILATLLQAAGRCEEAIAQDRKTQDLDPSPTHLMVAHTRLADCDEIMGRQKEALEGRVQARIASGSTPSEIAEFRKTYATSGKRGILEKDLKAALQRWNKDHWHEDAFQISGFYADLGDKDQAFAWIDKAIELRSGALIWLFVGPSPLSSDPRFSEVKRKMGVQN